MRVCFQIDHATQLIAGAWWEIGHEADQELACQYADPVSTLALAGVNDMLARPTGFPVHAWWDKLRDRISPLTWWEVAEVDDESYGYELLFKTSSCHPRPVLDPEEDSAEPRSWPTLGSAGERRRPS